MKGHKCPPLPATALHEVGEVHQRARQPVHLGDDQHLRVALLDGQQDGIEPGSSGHGFAGDARVLVDGHQLPATPVGLGPRQCWPCP